MSLFRSEARCEQITWEGQSPRGMRWLCKGSTTVVTPVFLRRLFFTFTAEDSHSCALQIAGIGTVVQEEVACTEMAGNLSAEVNADGINHDFREDGQRGRCSAICRSTAGNARGGARGDADDADARDCGRGRREAGDDNGQRGHLRCPMLSRDIERVM